MRQQKWTLAGMLLTISMAANAQMLKCTFKNFKATDDNVAVYYSSEGKILATEAVPMKWAADGSFTCDLDADKADLTLYVGDNDTFGAHVEKGKKVNMIITQEKDGSMRTDFSGDCRELSYAVSQMADAYSISRYFPMGGEEPDMSVNRPILDRMYQGAAALLKKVKDKKARAEYTELNEYQYKFMKIRLMMEDAYKKNKKVADYPEYQEIVKNVDLNSDISYRTMLSTLILDGYHTVVAPIKGNMGDYCRETMSICDKYVTNPKLRKAVVKDVGNYYFAYGDNSGDFRQFYADACRWAGADSTLLAPYKSVMDSWEKTKSGIKASDITLTDADGKTTQLLDLIKGKFAYIDVWATWCGPCKKEIPNFARLAEKYNGKNGIIFVSISVDENTKAWKKMISEDKPSWLQYNITGEVNKEFSGQWGITGIPRFIMIDKNGNIKMADAPRPSSEEAEKILNGIVNGEE